MNIIHICAAYLLISTASLFWDVSSFRVDPYFYGDETLLDNIDKQNILLFWNVSSFRVDPYSYDGETLLDNIGKLYDGLEIIFM